MLRPDYSVTALQRWEMRGAYCYEIIIYSYLFIFCNIDYQTLTTHSLSHTKQKKECRKAFFRMVAIMNLTLLVLEQKTINNVAICGHIIDCCF